jgi:hypothetical protein
MIQTFTHNDLIRYAYNETSPTENQQIEDALMALPDLLDSYLGILDTQMALNTIKKAPSQKAVQNILSYSANHPRSNIRAN